MPSYRRQTALQGALYFSPKVEDWNWATIYYRQYRSIFNQCDIIGLNICRIPWKNACGMSAIFASSTNVVIYSALLFSSYQTFCSLYQ